MMHPHCDAWVIVAGRKEPVQDHTHRCGLDQHSGGDHVCARCGHTWSPLAETDGGSGVDPAPRGSGPVPDPSSPIPTQAIEAAALAIAHAVNDIEPDDYAYDYARAAVEAALPALNPPVQGHCPMGCGQTLYLNVVARAVTCSNASCPSPVAIDVLLEDPETEHIVDVGPSDFALQHPLRERLYGLLFDCQLHQHLSDLPAAPVAPGRYRVAWDPALRQTGIWEPIDPEEDSRG